MSEERVGGRAGTAAPQGVVCELPNPPLLLPSSVSPQRQADVALAPAFAGAFFLDKGRPELTML
jgi:hypothetical protein